MAQSSTTTNNYYDVITSFEQGVNSGITPLLLPKNQLAFALNATVRGGNITSRPPVLFQQLNFNGDAELESAVLLGFFQGSGIYRPDFGPSQIIAQISGRLFTFTPTSREWTVAEITVPGDPNSVDAAQVWMWQSERWMIINDGSGALPIFYDGVSSRRSYGPSVVVGTVIATSVAAPPPLGTSLTLTLSAPYNGPPQIIFNGTIYEVTASSTAVEVEFVQMAVSYSTAPNNTLTSVRSPQIGDKLYAYPSRIGMVSNSAIGANGYYSTTVGVFPSGTREVLSNLQFNLKHGLNIGDQFIMGGKVWDVYGVINAGAVRARRMFGPAEAIAPNFYQNGSLVTKPQSLPAVLIGTVTALIGQRQDTVPYNGSSGFYFRVELDTPFTYGTEAVIWDDAVWGSVGVPFQFTYSSYVSYPVTSTSVVNSITVTNLNDTTTANYVLPQDILSVPELPPGRMGAYGMGRNWMSLIDGISYIAGDQVGGAAGSSQYNFRDAVLKTTENDFLSGGGYFRLPGSGNVINSMNFVATLDASQGQGALMIGTDVGFFSNNTPTDRDTWANLTNPILTESLIGQGSLAQNSTVLANSDILYRSIEGMGSLVVARRNFNSVYSWGNTPISREMDPTFRADNNNLLIFSSAVTFDNRLLMTVSPTANGSGTYHRGAVALNFDTVSSITSKAAPVYDGLWTGLNIMQFLSGNFSGTGRAFAFAYNVESAQIELYELLTTVGRQFYDNRVFPILWSFETPVMFNRDVKPMSELARLLDAEMYVQEVVGEVHIKVEYRPDFYPCWVTWREFDICADNTITNGKPGYRTRLSLGDPSNEDCDAANGYRQLKIGHFFQFRFTFTGHLKFMGFRAQVTTEPAPDFAAPECRTVCAETIPMPT